MKKNETERTVTQRRRRNSTSTRKTMIPETERGIGQPKSDSNGITKDSSAAEAKIKTGTEKTETTRKTKSEDRRRSSTSEKDLARDKETREIIDCTANPLYQDCHPLINLFIK